LPLSSLIASLFLDKFTIGHKCGALHLFFAVLVQIGNQFTRLGYRRDQSPA
jgi:hypothetical protein